MRTNLSQERGELLFLASMTVVTAYLVYETTTLTRPDSALVPWVILAIMVFSLIGIFVMKLFGDSVRGVFGLGDDSEWLDIGDIGADEDAENETMFEIDLWGVTKELVWIAGYIVGMVYVGFFTTTILFINAYIFIKETSSIKYRLAYMAVWTTGVLIVLYVLFVELLRVSSIFRLGFLP